MKVWLLVFLISVAVSINAEKIEAKDEEKAIQILKDDVDEADQQPVDLYHETKLLKKRSPRGGRSRERYGNNYGHRGRSWGRVGRSRGGRSRGGRSSGGRSSRSSGGRSSGGRSRGGRSRGGRSSDQVSREHYGYGGYGGGYGGYGGGYGDSNERDPYSYHGRYGYPSNHGSGGIIRYGVRTYVPSSGNTVFDSGNCNCPFSSNNKPEDNGNFGYLRQWQRAFSSHPCCRQRWQVYWATQHRK